MVFFIDGGSRGNPGPAGYGVAIQSPTGERLDSISKFIGICTNNVAEYSALLAGLEYAVQHHYAHVKFNSDSELLVKQIQGEYRVKSPDLRLLFDRAKNLIQRIPRFEIQHVRREQNTQADALANEAMDQGAPVSPRVIRCDAVFESGILKPLSRLELPEKQIVECTIRIKG